MESAVNDWLYTLSFIIKSNYGLAPFLAFFAGILVSFTPCSLSGVPLVIGYVGGAAGKNTRKAFHLSLVFAFGMALTYTVLGTLASILGRLLQGAGSWWYILLGILMILMALQTWGIINFIPSTYAVNLNKKQGYIGAILAGILAGLFSSPCATPVLVVLLALVAEKGSLIWGVLLLLVYSAGHSILVIIAGTSIGFVRKLSASGNYGRTSRILNFIMGIFMVAIALYMFYLGF